MDKVVNHKIIGHRYYIHIVIAIMIYFQGSSNLYSQSTNFFKALFLPGTSSFITKNKEQLDSEFCKMFKNNQLEFDAKDESKKKLSAHLNLACDFDSNQIEMSLKIDDKSLIIYKGNVKLSKMSDGTYLLSNEKFRFQINILNKNSNIESCNLVLYDILNNLFYSGERCRFKNEK